MHRMDRARVQAWPVANRARNDRRAFCLRLLGLPAALALLPYPAGAVLVEHAMGRTQVPMRPARVITLFQGATDIALALGVRPVATVDSWTEKPVYRYLRTQMGDAQSVGLETQPSLEDIAQLQPDLIIGSKFRNERAFDLLSKIAPTVLAQDVYSFESNTRLIGAALHREAQAARLLAQLNQRVAALRAKLKQKFGPAWPLTVSVLDVRSDHIRLYLADSFAGALLSALGFAWPSQWRDGSRSIIKLTSKERIPVTDADVFFVLLRSDSAVVRNNYLAWSGHPLWQQLQAVKNGRVHHVNNVYWSLAGGIQSAFLMLDELQAKMFSEISS